jgi:FdhD protein
MDYSGTDTLTVPAQEPLAVLLGPAARSQPLLPLAPHLDVPEVSVLRRVRALDTSGAPHWRLVPAERPLTLTVEGEEAAALWTLGGAAGWLVTGYLLNHGLIADVTQLAAVSIDWEAGAAHIQRRPGVGAAPCTALRTGSDTAGVLHFSGGGLPELAAPRLSGSTLQALLTAAAQGNAIHRAAGAVHGCRLFCGAELWLSIEDVGRRNAIDAVCGWMALHGVSGEDKILLTTGRLNAEVVMNAARSRIPIVAAHKGVTAAACDLAQRLGMMLLAHAAPGRCCCYAGGEGFDASG